MLNASLALVLLDHCVIKLNALQIVTVLVALVLVEYAYLVIAMN
jgi:hypothetical protein